MSTIKIFKEKVLPSTLIPNSIYLISKITDPTYVEIYITGKTSDIVRRIINTNDVQSMIDASIGDITTDGIRVINGKTGESVTLNYEDVGADANGAALAVKNELEPLITNLSDNKLDKIDYVQHYKGLYTSLLSLTTAFPTANNGDYAHIDIGTGNDRQTAIWDGDDNKWVISSSSGGNVSNTDEISEGNTNLFFTSERVRSTTINNISVNNNPVSVGDTYETAFSKLKTQLEQSGGNSNDILDLNLIDIADKIQTTMNLTPDVNNYIDGTNIIGDVKTPTPLPPEIYYDQYTLINSQNMILQPNSTFVPDELNNPMLVFSGDISALSPSQYLINIGQQEHTFIHFKNSSTNEILELHIDNSTLRITLAGQVAVYANSLVTSIVIEIYANNTIRVLKWNDSLDVRPNLGSLPSGFDIISMIVSKNDGSTPVEHTSSQFIQIARGINLVTLKPLSAYFKVTKGKFTLKIDSTKSGALYIFNRDTQPTSKLTYQYVTQNYINNIALGIQSLGNGSIFLLIGRVVGENSLSIQINDAVGIESFTFEILNNTTIDIYRGNVKIGNINVLQDILPYYQTVCEFPAPELDSFGYDFTDSYEQLNYRLPLDANDGDTYYLLSDGTLFNKQLQIGDYITVYANKSNVAITRLPVIPIRKKLPIIRNANYITIEDLYAIYDEQTGTITLSGSYHHSDDSTIGLMFMIDVSSINKPIILKSGFVGLVSGNIYYFNTELTDGKIYINTLDSTIGTNIFLNTVIGET